MGDDIPGIAAAVDDFLEQVVKVAQGEYFDRLVPTRIQLAEEVERVLVSLAFDLLDLAVHFLGLIEPAGTPNTGDAGGPLTARKERG